MAHNWHERLTGLAISIVKSNKEVRSKLHDKLLLKELCASAELTANERER